MVGAVRTTGPRARPGRWGLAASGRLLVAVVLAPVVLAEEPAPRAAPAPSWPEDVVEVQIVSSVDGARQRAMFRAPPDGSDPRPLLVLLHTWSADFRQFGGATAAILEECQRRRWVFIQPDFRGPNRRPEAAGSELALRDIRDAVEWARAMAPVDDRRVYAVGTSGGGHAALMAAARWPSIWAAVSSWVPPTDLAAWHAECTRRALRYSRDLEAVCGGPPDASARVRREYELRSPVTRLHRAVGVPIEIASGIHDGHRGSVPVSHALRAFGVLARACGHPERALTDEEIRSLVREERVPPELARPGPVDPEWTVTPLLRREAGTARVTIFEGGHECDPRAALSWLARHRR